MIRKSGSRFSEKIMLYQKLERQSIQSETIALWSGTSGLEERLAPASPTIGSPFGFSPPRRLLVFLLTKGRKKSC
jgi:hypothetical protein